uniref:Legume lectin domain-containing protein n=1 Tax=Nelumbo nucifera TaxID=4432 RepID=A0A822XXP5_NELNU|nr:TPA_asm: hypothetical protein HUJ06_025239 [Nelumbo nucifera]
MALFHSSNSHLQSSNLVLILFHIFLFFSFFIVSATPLSFNYPKFPSDMADELEFQGDAYHSPSNTLALTIGEVDKPFNFSAGRVIYKKPIHLWDNATNNLTDFITHFSFLLFPFH